MKKIYALLSGILLASGAYAQILAFDIRPGVNLGYTFGAGLTYGFTADFLVFQASPGDLYSGISLDNYWVHGKKHKHHLITASVLMENPNFQGKIGYGNASYRWGYGGNRNRCHTKGISWDVSYTTANPHTPRIGYKSFHYLFYRWPWPERFYQTVYTGYRYTLPASTPTTPALTK